MKPDDDFRKQVELRPEEFTRDGSEPISTPPSASSLDPWHVLGIVAVIGGLYLANHGLPNTDPFDMGAAVLFGLFCLWNYWPRR